MTDSSASPTMATPPEPEADGPEASRAPWWAFALLAAGIAVQLVWGFWASFSIFSPYDDEGFLRSSEQFFLQGTPLYTELYSQYGPAYYLASWLGHAGLRVPFGPDVTRWANLLCYVGASALMGWCAFRLTRSWVGLVAGQIMAFQMVNSVRWSPGHPQEMCVVLLGLCALAACYALNPTTGKPRALKLFVMGACAGLLFGVKLNLGVFLGLTLLLTLLWGARVSEKAAGASRVARFLATGAGLILPVYLLRGHLAESGGLLALAVLVAFALASWGASRLEGGVIRGKDFLPAAAGFAVAVVIPALFVLARGTRPGDLVYGMLTQHLAREDAFYAGLAAYPWLYVLALPLAVAAHLLFAGPLRNRLPEEKRRVALAVAKAVVGLLFIHPSLTAIRNFVPLLPLVAVLFLMPIPGREPPAWQRFARVVLCFAAVLETLWVYPVAAGQVGCAALLPTLLAACCLGDAWRMFAEGRTEEGENRVAAPVLAGVSLLVVAGYAASFGVGFAEVWKGYHGFPPAGLPGARYLRLPEEDVRNLRAMTAYLRARPEAVVPLPGTNTILYWSGKEPVSPLLTAGRWMTLLSRAEQERVIARLRELEAGPGVVVLFNAEMATFWARGVSIRNEPLVKYLGEAYTRPVARFGYYVVLENPASGKGAGSGNAGR